MTNMQVYSGKCSQTKIHLLFFLISNSNYAISKSSIGLITLSNNLRPYRNPDSRQPNNELTWLHESCTIIGQGSQPALYNPIRTHRPRKHSPPPFSPILSPHQFSNFPAPSRLAIIRSILFPLCCVSGLRAPREQLMGALHLEALVSQDPHTLPIPHPST
jgi:hypothetical protein